MGGEVTGFDVVRLVARQMDAIGGSARMIAVIGG